MHSAARVSSFLIRVPTRILPCIAKYSEPILFHNYPEVIKKTKTFIVQNFVGISIEKVRDFLLSTLIPTLYDTWKKEQEEHGDEDEEELSLEQFKKIDRLPTLHVDRLALDEKACHTIPIAKHTMWMGTSKMMQ